MDENSEAVFEYLERSREALCRNPFDMAFYEKAIRASRLSGELESLREFRNMCAEYCAVDENFWLEYIEDERRYLGSTGKLNEEVRKLTNLFEIAVVNCPSTELWNSYSKFLFEVFAMDEQDLVTLGDIRNVYERSLDALGLHALDGPSLWASYRQFESTLLSSQLASNNTAAASEQVKRVRQLFLRQLELPLGGLPDLLDEYRVWEEDLPQEFKHTTTLAENAHRVGHVAWEARKGFEMKAQSEIDEIAEPFALDHVWAQYILFEKSQCPITQRVDPNRGGDLYKAWAARVCVIYHRALEYLGFARWDLWVEYFDFCSTQLHDSIKSLCVARRACRHLPRVFCLWLMQAQALATSGAQIRDITALIGKVNIALSNPSCVSDVLITVSEISPKLRSILEKIYITKEVDPEDIDIGSGTMAFRIELSSMAPKNLQLFMAHLVECRACTGEFWPTLERLVACGINCPKTWSVIARSLYKHSLGAVDGGFIDIVATAEKQFGPDFTRFAQSISTGIHDITPADLATIVYKMGFNKLIGSVSVNDADKAVKDGETIAQNNLRIELLCSDFVRFSKEINCDKAIRVSKLMSGYGIHRSSARAISSSLHWVQAFRMKRHKRRRRLESESENSSDGSQAGSRHIRYLDQSGWYGSPCISPVVRSRSASPETSGSGSPIQPLSPVIAPRQVERVTRATWFGKESVEPSLAPAVIPSKDEQDSSHVQYNNEMGAEINPPKMVVVDRRTDDSMSQRNTLYVTNVVISATSLDIARHVLSHGCQGLVDVRLGKPRPGQQVTFAYVEFLDIDSAKKAKSKLNKTLLSSLPLIVQMSRPKKTSPAYMPNTLFCSAFNIGIPLVRENQGRIKDAILTLIPNSTAVITIRLVLNFDNPMEFKNYCYIDFDTSMDATEALSLNLMKRLVSTSEIILSRSLRSEKPSLDGGKAANDCVVEVCTDTTQTRSTWRI
ncbi:Squamous cell carcinoma antigen recognized by T-cells 3 [Babesia microti strain RI]|uniref:Squamous cell carcinoma antigen recognized by T-cells 3 n=1 Tax=Babesia microti (strain RI) TaxID=1133968 RepID=I7I9K6_BABMR|nr:Squamous cell carcinoma antigen recognized by T-cells 3 [Babesia microti strain RI]CCF75204.1 Squamous cell carcinoma antigen recognized by T-cells 3 [Babesia microti strain RI]|eukprot:XP_012649612.1 Squamous cell carcinoma antigen recognized by T-cells 3 [Babesia microti strain RI]